jgi:cytochrome oxidase assembly protein ShyY1
LALLLLGLGVVAFSTLGFWQLRRAADKERLLAAYAGAAGQATLDLGQARQSPADGPYPHVRVRGRFDPVHTYWLDDQVRNGRQGRFAFAVFEPAGSSPGLLVNRGFVVHGGETGIPELPDGEVELSGLYAPPPGTGLRLGGNPLPHSAQWPKLTIYIDTQEIAQDAGQPLDERILLLDAAADSGFEREWTPQILPPERHRGYAFQWFCFSIVSIVIFIVLHWRRRGPDNS